MPRITSEGSCGIRTAGCLVFVSGFFIILSITKRVYARITNLSSNFYQFILNMLITQTYNANFDNRQKELQGLSFCLMDIDETIRSKLLRLLGDLKVSQGLSQRQVALRCDIDPMHFNQILHGRKGMGKDIMTRLCRAFNLEPIYFYITSNTPILATEREKILCRRLREYPQMLDQISAISEALETTYKSRKNGEHTPIQKGKKKKRLRTA